jgi:hypothetical protein
MARSRQIKAKQGRKPELMDRLNPTIEGLTTAVKKEAEKMWSGQWNISRAQVSAQKIGANPGTHAGRQLSRWERCRIVET